MPLTDAAIRKVKPADKPQKLTDGGGLYLHVTPAGGRHWRWRYEFGGKEKTLTIGSYPEIGLADARSAREDARRILKGGRDPSVVRRHQKAAAVAESADTFEALAREWHGTMKSQWVPKHAGDVLGSLEADVFPAIGQMPIRDITPPLVLSVLRDIISRPAVETAHRVRQRMSAVFVFAIASGRAETDPAAIVAGALPPITRGRQPAVRTLDEARAVLRAAEAQTAHPVTKLALRLLALTAVRPGTLAATPWSEIPDLDATAPDWTISAARMKLRKQHKGDADHDHTVALSRQAVDVLKAVRDLTGAGPLVFPNTRHAHRPMSENALGYLLNRAGFHGRHVPHGWRATFSTVMNERFPSDRAVIDLMLSHTPQNKVEAAYNRSLHLARRRALAQEWADLLLEGAPPATALLVGPRR